MRRDELRALLEGAGIRLRRSSGQNFLVEENLADAIARDGGILPGDVVLEIGTGIGLLTRRLVGPAVRVVSVELDRRVLALAREELADLPGLTLLEADALAGKNQLNPAVLGVVRDLLGAPEASGELRVVANLPYNVATSLVMGLLREELPLARMVVMVQLEAAQRFAAGPGDPLYGAVSVLCAALCQGVRLLRRVPREVFLPRPKVTSAVVRFDPRPDRRDSFEPLSEVVRGLFTYRRKTLAKAAAHLARREPGLTWLREAVIRSGVGAQRRPEDLALEEFRALLGARSVS